MDTAAAPTAYDDNTRATGIVAAGMMAMNALTYAFTLLAAHLLGPRDFGAVSALMGILIVIAVPSLALQATAARRLATADPSQRAGVTRDILVSSWKLAAAVALLLLVLAPVVNQVLHLDDLVTALLLSVSSIPLTLMGAYAGITQGERRWTSLALIYLAMGAGRLVGGAAAMLAEGSLRSAMIGMTLGSFAPPLVGACLERLPAHVTSDHAPLLRELWRNGHTLLALFVFINLDVLLARYLFDEHDAGIYAAGAIIAKTCLFIPTFVLVVAFPTMATDRTGRPWLKPTLTVLGLGLVAVVGARLLSDLAVTFAGGGEYTDLADLAWLFALEGTMFAVLQILIYDAIAGQTHAGFVLWLAAALVTVIAVAFIDSVSHLVTAVTVVTVVACGVALVTSLMPGATHPD
jgi:O-antigen/teichoic acid export membrane protein